MLTAVSVARDCEMVPTGQRVITVHSIHTPPAQPHIFYTLADTPPPLSGNNVTNDDVIVSIIHLYYLCSCVGCLGAHFTHTLKKGGNK